MKKNGFTLMELLVVITIMAIIAAMLMPALSSAREKARQASCMNGQRQLAMASTIYMGDFGDAIFTSGGTGTLTHPYLLTGVNKTGTNYRTYGTEYLKQRDPAFYCPSLPHEFRQSRLTTSTSWHWNVAPMNSVSSGEAYSSSTIWAADNNRTVYVLRRRRANNPANYWFYTENYRPDSAHIQWLYLQLSHVTGTSTIFGIHLRHNNTANMVFFDGHAESVTVDRLKTVEPVPFAQAYDKDNNRITF